MDNNKKILLAVAAATGVFVTGLGIYYFAIKRT
jgi:hypothetical protein